MVNPESDDAPEVDEDYIWFLRIPVLILILFGFYEYFTSGEISLLILLGGGGGAVTLLGLEWENYHS